MGLFDMFKKAPKTFPVLTPESLEPVDAAINTTQAKKVYREWMWRIGYYTDKEELAYSVGWLAEEIKGETENLRLAVDEALSNLEDAKEAVAEARTELASVKKRLAGLKKTCQDPEADEISDTEIELDEAQYELEGRADELEDAKREAAEARAALAAFRKDKRKFLVEYVNREVHGSSHGPTAEG